MALFRQADAQDLPFNNNTFDAVIGEAVTAYPTDQQQAVNEYARVLKHGGYIGINESTYLQPDPPQEIQDWVCQDTAMYAHIHTSQGWQALLENAGLEVMAVRLFPMDVKRESAQTMKRYGVFGLARTWSRAVGMYVTHPEARDIMKLNLGDVPPGLMDFYGYGIYIARKPDR
jgi:ubiquinone/menaquinone biosynthesis C-methylase UbiE